MAGPPVWPDPVEGEYKSGKSYLTACLESHHPVDLVIIALGTNDLKHRFGQSAWDIARSAATLVQIVQGGVFGPGGATPRVLLVAPTPTCVAGGPFAEMFAGAARTSRDLGRCSAAIAGRPRLRIPGRRQGHRLDEARWHPPRRRQAGETREGGGRGSRASVGMMRVGEGEKGRAPTLPLPHSPTPPLPRSPLLQRHRVGTQVHLRRAVRDLAAGHAEGAQTPRSHVVR